MIIRQGTKDILVASLRELAEHKNVNKITIKEITDNCGLSPATFYRHFRDKYDLITWDYANRVGKIMACLYTEDCTWKQVLLHYTKFYYEQRHFFVNILCHTSGCDSFVRNMAEVGIAAIEAYIKRKNGRKALSKETVLYIRFYCLGAVQLICEWLAVKAETKPEKMAEILANAVPVPIARYFT